MPTLGEEVSAAKRRALELNHRYVVPGRVERFLSWGVPLVIGRREGYYLWDLDGHRLLDLHLNGGVFNLGHRNPELTEALRAALDEVDIGNHHFPSLARGELAERLIESAPGDLRYAVFATGGSEAVDVAIKSARRATGRRRVVGMRGGYHGRTGLSGAVGDASTAEYFLCDQPDLFVQVPFNDLDALEQELDSEEVAAVVVETIPATYGFPLPAPGYLQGIQALCREHGALYVADEVQTGLGRSGRLWAVECYGVEPDILVTGKGLSGGLYPIAATLLSEEAGSWLRDNGWGHVSSFGGAELGCRVALKVLEITQRPATVANVERVAAKLGDGLRELATRRPFLSGVRQQGVIFGLELDDEAGALRLLKPLYDRGVWAMFAGFDPSVLQCKPGLLFSESQCEELLESLDDALQLAERMEPSSGTLVPVREDS